MSFAVIENGIVTNVYVSDSALNENDVQTDTAGIGWTYTNGAFSAPVTNGAFSAPVQPAQPAPTIKQQIDILESTTTPRRTREAILGIDNGWLANVNTEIAALRAQLTKT
jgi:hypothetical protein